MAYISVEIDVELKEFDDQELIDELEERGYRVDRVVEDSVYVPEDLIQEEIEFIVGMFSTYMPGTIGYNIYEKMRKR
jgi:hypothetical protein